MSYFDDASLVMIPSGYKTSKVYSVKPTDGTGDLTFSRSNDTATRVGPDGLIEKVRTNLILQSETFDNAAWDKVTTTISANTTANPIDGTVNADTINLGAGTTQKFIAQVISLNGNYTISVYLKAGTHQFAQILLGTDSTPFANFDLVNGTASASGSTATIVSAGNGWYRCSMAFSTSTGNSVFILASDSLATSRFQITSSTGTLIAFGYQLETGDIATDYIPTTSAAVSVGPVASVPRLDYLNSSCPRLLLEPQRTNLLTYSEQLNNANWGSFQSASVTANTTISPDGYQNADTITFSSDPSSLIFQNYTSTSSTFTISVYAKSSTGKKFCFRNFDGVGVVRSSDFTTTSSWQRFSFTFTSALANVAICNEVGGNVGSIQVYGCQLELGAYATSYIPTLGAAVTRGADAASKTGISSLIGQTEGTIFADITIPTMANTGANFVSVSLFNAGLTNTTQFDIYDSGDLLGVCVNGTVQALITKSGFTAGRHKVAFGYKANDFVLYVDGVLVGTDTSGTVGAQDSFGLQYGTSQFIGQQYVSQALVFKTRLTNAQLAELTTI